MDDETVAVRAFCRGLLAVAKKAAERTPPKGAASREEATARHENLRAALLASTKDDATIKAYILRGKD